jgi:hypothetical protein
LANGLGMLKHHQTNHNSLTGNEIGRTGSSEKCGAMYVTHTRVRRRRIESNRHRAFEFRLGGIPHFGQGFLRDESPVPFSFFMHFY